MFPAATSLWLLGQSRLRTGQCMASGDCQALELGSVSVQALHPGFLELGHPSGCPTPSWLPTAAS